MLRLGDLGPTCHLRLPQIRPFASQPQGLSRPQPHFRERLQGNPLRPVGASSCPGHLRGRPRDASDDGTGEEYRSRASSLGSVGKLISASQAAVALSCLAGLSTPKPAFLTSRSLNPVRPGACGERPASAMRKLGNRRRACMSPCSVRQVSAIRCMQRDKDRGLPALRHRGPVRQTEIPVIGSRQADLVSNCPSLDTLCNRHDLGLFE